MCLFNILLFKSNEIMLKVESNDLIFIKMDLILAKLFIFVINYLFSKKNYIFVNYDSNQMKLYQNKILTKVILIVLK